jgi:hypothetical protein
MPNNQPHPKPDKNGGKKETTNRHVYVEPGVQIDFVKDLREQHKTEHDEDTAHNKRQLFWTKVGAVLVLAYAILTFWQACSTRQASLAATDSARTAVKSMRTDQRAWVIMAPEVSPDLVPEAALKLPIDVLNSGKTVARKVVMEAEVKVMLKGEPFDFSYDKRSVEMKTGTIFPNNGSATQITISTTNDRNNPRKLTTAEVQNLREGRAFVVFYSSITYLDIFDVTRWTHQCSIYTYSPLLLRGDLSFSDCVAYNDADNN